MRVAAPTQVHLRVRVAEVSRDVLKQFGINWEAIFQTGDFAFGLVSGRAVTDGLGSFLRAPGGANSAFGSFENGNDVVNAALDALAEEGLVNVLAEPNLTALSGETASFLAGGEFPIPIDSGDDGLSDRVQGVRHQPRVHADRAERRPDQPAGAARGQRPDRQGRDQPSTAWSSRPSRRGAPRPRSSSAAASPSRSAA